MRLIAAAWLLSTALAAPSPEPPVEVGLLLDTSGSIRATDIARARALSSDLLKALPKGSEVAVFTFDDQPRLVLPRSSDVDAVEKAIGGAKVAGHWTALNDAIYDASRYLRDTPSSRRAIVIITDGLDENSTLKLEDALAGAQASGIPVYAIGVGSVQERILRRIAKLTGGDYVAGAAASGESLAQAIAHRSWPSPLPAPSPQPPGVTKPLTEPQSRLTVKGAVGLLLLALIVFLAFLRRGGAERAGREEIRRTSARPEPPPQNQETLVERLSGTEEYLERTVTLQESPSLAIVRGPGLGESYPLRIESATSLGRAKANDIVLKDIAISSQHCRIRREDGRFVLHDLKSTNGTFVNDRRVSRCLLSEGDEIKIGETVLRFRVDQTKG